MEANLAFLKKSKMMQHTGMLKAEAWKLRRMEALEANRAEDGSVTT